MKTTFNKILNISLVLISLIVFGGNAWGTEQAITLSSGSHNSTTKVITWSASNVCTITQAPSGTTNETTPNSSYVSAPRWYKWNVITFTATSGKKFNSIVITCTTDSYASNLATSTYNVTTGGGSVSAAVGTGENSSKVTITCTNTVTEFTINMGNQARLSGITVDYATIASTFTVTVNSNNTNYGTVSQASVTNVANNTSISADGTTLTVGTTTITATPHAQDADYNYAFSSWTGIPAGGKVTADVTATANFTRTERALTNYRTLCCEPLGSINGSVSVSQTSAVVKLASAYAQASNADGYQLKVEGSSNYDDWTDIDKDDLTTSVGVTVNGLACGTDYTAYLRAKGSGTYCDYGTESHVDFTTSKYSISVADGITNGTIVADKTTACAGETVTLTVTPSPEGNGYHLASWSLNGTAQDVNTLTFTMPEGNATISGAFEANNVPMAINITSTDKATVTSSVTSALANTNITLSCTDIDEGYQFFGWTVTAGGNPVEVTNPTSATGASFTMPAAVVTVTADIRQMVTVTFKRNNVTYDTQSTYVGGTVTFPSNPTKFDDDYPNFVGWADAISGVATSAPTLKSASEVINANVEYHAVFGTTPVATGNYAKITTLDDLESGVNYVIAVNNSGDYALQAEKYSDQYYYYMKAASVTVTNDEISNPASDIIWDVTKNSNGKVYIKNGNNYLYITYTGQYTNLKLATSIDNENEEWYTPSFTNGVLTLTSQQYTNYQLAYATGSNFKEYKAGTSTIGSLYIYKQQYSQEFVTRQIVKHTISYNKNTEDEVTGSLPANATIVDGEDYTVSDATLSRAGYNFIGWNTSNTATTAQTTIVNVTANATLYAVWEQIPTYNIEFSVNGAKVETLKLADQLEGTAIVFPDAAAITAASAFPTTDKKFVGWIEASSYASDDAPTFVTSATATADKVYYAVFADQVSEGGYNKLTSTAGLTAGDKIVVTNGSSVGMKAFGQSSDNNFKGAEIEIEGNQITNLGEACELTLGGTAGHWTLFDGAKYVYAAGSAKSGSGYNNYMKGKDTKDAACEWTISIDGETTTIRSVENTATSYMRYNSSNTSVFSCYNTASQNAVVLFKKAANVYEDYVTNIATLNSIAITTAPKTVYKKGETLDLTGMVVKATYSDSRVRTLSSDKYTVDLADEALAASNNKFTVSYTEGETTKTAEQTIAVYELTLIAVTNAPATTTYLEGATFDKTGMEVTATWGTGADKIVETLNAEDYTVSPSLLDATSITSVTLSYTHEDVTKTTTQAVTVNERPSLTMSWKVAGATTTSKIYINNEEKYLLVLPSAPDVPEAFGAGYVFIGWTSDATIAKNGQGINWAANNDVMAKATEFKAVFAQVNAPLFKETFDGCEGTGGNDDNWSGTIASSTVNTDNNGWTFANEGGANACVKFGTGSKKGSAETPSFSLTGSATLTFKAGAWDSNSEGTTLNISATGATLKQNDAAISSVTLTKGAWTTYSIDVTEATGTVKIKFEAQNASNNRFFLDEVMIKQGDEDYKDYRFVPSNVARPEIELAEATYYGAQNATITQSQSKQIFYSLDGNTWTEYTAPVALDQAGEVTLSAKAYDSDEDDYSSVVSKSYTIVTEIDAPTMTASCVFVDEQTVTISHDMSGTEGFALQYSYDGENYTDYTEALILTETATIYAKATIGSLEATANATYTKGYPVEYNKVTSADGLAIGQQFILKASSANSAAGALSDNILASVDIPAEVSNIITLINEPVTVFELGGRSGAYTLISDGKYLKYKSDKKLEYSTTVADTWTITYSAGTPTIKNVTNSSYSLQYNSSSPRFTVYSSDQTDVAIYAKEAIVYTITIKNYDGSDKTTDKVVEGSSFILTEADAPTDYPANYEFLNKWTDGTNTYAVGDEVVVSAAKTLEPCWKVTTPADADINTLPTSVTEIVVTDGKTLTIGAAGRSLDNLTVEAGGKVTGSATLNVQDLTIKTSLGTISGTDNTNGKSGQISGSIEAMGDVYIQIELTQASEASYGWYAFSVPFRVDAMNGVYYGDTKLTNEVGYAIMAFHEDKYAAGEYAWKKYRDIMEPGKLYIISVGDTDYKTLRFKKVADAPIIATSNEVELARSDEGDNAGWNGVGNPNLQVSHQDAISIMQFLDHEANSFIARSAAKTDLMVGTAFMIQRPNETSSIEIKIGGNTGDDIIALAPAREPAAIEKTLFEAKLTNTTTGRTEDNLYFTAREDATNTYEAGRDVTKLSMGNAKNTQMTISAYGKQLCAADFPLVNGQAEYPLVINAPKAGNYSISTVANANADIYLTYEGSIIWNLSMGAYEIELAKGATNGYGLLLQAKAPQVVTGVDSVQPSEVSIQKVIIDEHVFILRGGQMYDVTGKAVK